MTRLSKIDAKKARRAKREAASRDSSKSPTAAEGESDRFYLPLESGSDSGEESAEPADDVAPPPQPKRARREGKTRTRLRVRFAGLEDAENTDATAGESRSDRGRKSIELAEEEAGGGGESSPREADVSNRAQDEEADSVEVKEGNNGDDEAGARIGDADDDSGDGVTGESSNNGSIAAVPAAANVAAPPQPQPERPRLSKIDAMKACRAKRGAGPAQGTREPSAAVGELESGHSEEGAEQAEDAIGSGGESPRGAHVSNHGGHRDEEAEPAEEEGGSNIGADGAVAGIKEESDDAEHGDGGGGRAAGEAADDGAVAAAAVVPAAPDKAPSPLRLWLRGLEVDGVAAGRFERYAKELQRQFANLDDLALVPGADESRGGTGAVWDRMFGVCGVTLIGDQLRIERAVRELPGARIAER